MLRSKIDEAVVADEPTRLSIIGDLAAHPVETLSELVQTQGQIGIRLSMLIRVVRTIGYPANASAVPWLIASVSPNRGAWADTVEAVAELDPDVVMPHLIQRLLAIDGDRAIAIEDLCPLLRELDTAYAIGSGPAITHLLATHAYPEDPSILLDVLEKAGPECANYALPTLVDLLHSGSPRDSVARVRHLIATFDQAAIENYRLLIADFDQRLSDLDGSASP